MVAGGGVRPLKVSSTTSYGLAPSMKGSDTGSDDGLHLYSAFLTIGYPKRFTILPHVHPFIHTFNGGVSHAGRQPACQEWSG